MSEAQTSDAVLMVRPAAFGFNPETAQSNAFSHRATDDGLQARVLGEFDRLAEQLSGAGVEVVVLDDGPDPPRPDAVFPNNWVSFHGDGTMVVYPMATPTRRLERRTGDLQALLERSGFRVDRVIDLSAHEQHGRFLEGTGSLILDRAGRRSFAALGPRTDAGAIAAFDQSLGYSTTTFDAADPQGRPIYHTNVLMSLGTKFALLCVDCIPARQRGPVIEAIESSGRTMIPIGFDQLQKFGCNAIELRSAGGQPLIALSTGALNAFSSEQRRLLEGFGELVHCDVPTIEQIGGGGVRCMIAEIFLPRTAKS